MSKAPSSKVLLERAVQRVANDERFVAAAFRAWCGGSLDLDAVAANLECPRSSAVRAALCQRPRSSSFRDDVTAIASSSAIDNVKLASLLREVASVAAFAKGAGRQLLAAARDAPDEPKEPKS
jgi:hypothetical protein